MRQITQDLIRENEKKANRFNLYANWGVMLLMIVILSIYRAIADSEDYELTQKICYFGIGFNVLSILSYHILKPESRILKYVFLVCWACFATTESGLSAPSETYALFFPIIISVCYFTPRLSIYSMVLMLFMLFIAKFINLFWGALDVGLLDLPPNLTITINASPDYVLMHQNWDRWGTFINMMLWQIPPAFLGLLAMGTFLSHVAKVGLSLMIKQARINLDQRLTQVEEFKSDLAASLLNINSISDSFSYVLNRLCVFTEAGWVSIVQLDKPENCWISTGAEKPQLDICKTCPLSAENVLNVFDEEEFFECTNDNNQDGLRIPAPCPAKSLISRLLKVGGKPWGVLSLHYCGNRQEFSQDDRYVINMTAELLMSAMEKIRLNRHLQRERDNAIAAEKSKSLFFATVSHDIRTPLNAILGFTELLSAGVDDEETRKSYLDSIAFSGNTLLQLLNDVLDLSKLEAGQIEYQKELGNFIELGNNMISAFKTLADKKSLTLQAKYADDMPLVEIAFQRTRQILFNLLGNAIKFTEQGGIILEAHFTKKDAKTGTLVFSVTDTGRGIAADDIPKLMKPFVQTRLQDQYNGTGLGLAICKTMLHQMGGSMAIQSELGKGSTFTVTMENIPFKEGNTKTEIPQINATETPQNCDFSELSLLIVDDSRVNIAVIKAMFKQLGISKISTAESGKDALECLKNEKIDIVFTDLWMPEMKGTELAGKVRNELHLDIPIVLVTADVDAPKNFKVLGITSILLKPITVNLLREQLTSLING